MPRGFHLWFFSVLGVDGLLEFLLGLSPLDWYDILCRSFSLISPTKPSFWSVCTTSFEDQYEPPCSFLWDPMCAWLHDTPFLVHSTMDFLLCPYPDDDVVTTSIHSSVHVPYRECRKISRQALKAHRASSSPVESSVFPLSSPDSSSTWDHLILVFLQDFNPSDFIHSMFHIHNIPHHRHLSPVGRRLINGIFPSTSFGFGSLRLNVSYVPSLSTFSASRAPSSTPLIMDTGASVCISPHMEDFISYSDRTVTIKDLSHANQVCREGMLHLGVMTKEGSVSHIEVMGYHMPNAEVPLLSPQVLILAYGGCMTQTSRCCTISLDSGITLEAVISPHNNLPVLEMAPTSNSTLWADAFGFPLANDCVVLLSIRPPLQHTQ